MSIESRTNSALFKRAEQLKRWEESDTNREPTSPKRNPRKVKFSSGCVFLAACAAGDKDEVLKLLEKGADINTANVDGLTALHQACIDDNLDMVEFLVEQGADVNRGDNEGWTPLHATASCAFLYIAKYLIEKGANVAAVNNDGELPIDITECPKMVDFLRKEIERRGIDCEAARNDEETVMLRDAKEWLASKSVASANNPNPKTGATALHVAAAKGYLDVIRLLLQCGADIDAQDVDGWTAMHAAAHWGQEEACRLLVDNLADMEAKNFVGQTPFDLADSDMLGVLEELRKKQNKEEVSKRKARKRLETRDRTIETDAESRVKKVKVEIATEDEEIVVNENIAMDVSSESDSSSDTETTETDSGSEGRDVGGGEEKKNRANSQPANETAAAAKEADAAKLPPIPPKPAVFDEENPPLWRKPLSKVTRPDSAGPDKNFRNDPSDLNNENEVTLRRTKSFQNDEQFYSRYKALHARIQANNDTPVISYNSNRPKSDIILTNSQQHYRNATDEKNDVSGSATDTSAKGAPAPPPNNQSAFKSDLKLTLKETPTETNGARAGGATTPTTPTGTRLQMFKNFFKSFVPPVRDEESETQRKAHAKRVRETRRSTQGVTLEEIKSAEQLVKMKSQPNNNNNNDETGTNGDQTNSVTATITTAAPTVITRAVTDGIEGARDGSSPGGDAQLMAASQHERRPSWRLKVDGGSKFKLEDATKPETPNTPSFVRRSAAAAATGQRPSSAPVETAETTTVTLSLRRPKSVEEKDQDKENDARNAQSTLATQAAIQRRRRPKRRSTGVVSFENIDDLDQDKDPSAGGDSSDAAAAAGQQNSIESGSDRGGGRSRLSSTVDIRNENGEIDYKKLYEEQLAENDRLKDKLRKTDEELRDTKQTLEKINVVTSKNSLSELEKRERRAMERKLSEMEEELKQLQKLKAENERLKADNRSLTRVINKLTNSTKK
ncbi:protein phosphatase 1 regulatory subunit 12A isoform X2 [Cylas formicarius]|uniref:protein phosphatase 1 regulatory subunit 12A isoform X2 n=1 Tax=Cylas formicarius TaxID=197179 RepID=UPI0029585534|nr:protein phosphatase 1 regulatory subunit 12A isoform X2 [Cylas formicarius]